MNKSMISTICFILGLFFVPSVSAATQNCTVNAGPIWNQHDAKEKCPSVCDNYGPWTGQWWTTEPGKMSACQCQGNNATKEAGPIWNQQDAEKKCPTVCKDAKGTWTGQWWTTEQGKMSVCQCSLCEPCQTKSEQAGPIWNQTDAKKKCPATCKDHNGSWTGQWWTTEPGKMSVCQCKECP